jgi:hypothetical protein
MKEKEFKDYHISPNQLTIKFDNGSTITDIPLFLSRHESYLANMREGKTKAAYQYRYEKVLALIKNGTLQN